MSRIYRILSGLIMAVTCGCYPGYMYRGPGGTSNEVTIQDTGADTEYKAQLRLQKEFMFVINSKGHPLKYPQTSLLYSGDKFISDNDYAVILRNALSMSYFSTKKRLSSIEEFDPESRPYTYLLDSHGWDPCVLYITSIDLKDESHSSGGTPGYWTGPPGHGMYVPGNPGIDYNRLKITFIIQLISYGRYQHQYTVSKVVDYPVSGEDLANYLEQNSKSILNEFSDRCFGY